MHSMKVSCCVEMLGIMRESFIEILCKGVSIKHIYTF